MKRANESTHLHRCARRHVLKIDNLEQTRKENLRFNWMKKYYLGHIENKERILKSNMDK